MIRSTRKSASAMGRLANRFALTGTSILLAVPTLVAHAQSTTGGGTTGTPGTTLTTPGNTTTTTQNTNTQSGTNTTPNAEANNIGTALNQPRAAVPLPNPNLAGSSLPDPYGFIRAEPFFIYPYVGVGFGRNTNLLGLQSGGISSDFMVMTPRIEAQLGNNSYKQTLSYTGNYGVYTGSHADDYNNHQFVAQTKDQLSARLDVNAQAYYLIMSDPRGSVTRAFSDRPDRWNAFGANGTVGYGAYSAPGRVEIDLGYTNKKYQNNLAITDSFDVNTYNVGGRFFYRIAPRTRLLTELRYTDYSYGSNPNLSSSEKRALLGATWDLAAATSGTAKIGVVKKSFNNGIYPDFSGISTEASVRWIPRTYSTIDFVAGRNPNDSTGQGSLTVDTYGGAVWTHQWRSYVSSQALVQYTNSDFKSFSRTDKYTTLQLGGYYDPRKWLRLGIQGTYQKRDSNVDILSFRRSILMLSVGITL